MSASNPLVALTRARVLEFVREPEALFWVFAFPIIMALVLGFAFRDRPPDPVPVGVVAGPTAADISAALSRLRHGEAGDLPDARRRASRPSARGRSPCSSRRRTRSSTTSTRRGPTRGSRASRWTTRSSAPAGAATRRLAREALVHEKGSRYIDFLLPGILGLNLMGTGIWGIGFSIVNARLKKTLKLMVATPMRKSDYLLAQMLSRFVFLVVEVVVILAFGVAVFQRADPRLARRCSASSPSSAPSASPASACSSSPARARSRRRAA